MKKLKTTKTIIAFLGDGDPARGIERICQITGSNKKQAYNWSKKFPAATYVAMTRELARLGATAPAQLWNMRGL